MNIGTTADDKSSRRVQVKDWLAVISTLPVLVTALFLLRQTFEAFRSPQDWGISYLGMLELLAQLLIPLIIGTGAVWISRQRRIKRGMWLGIMVTFLAYVVLYLAAEYQVGECQRQSPSFICGEWNFFLYLIWLVMFVVDVLALAGLNHLLDRRNKYVSRSAH